MKTQHNIRIIAIFLFLCFFKMEAFSQDPLILNSTDIKEVKIYQTGAMITRTVKASVNQGLQEIVFDGLSQYINPESITLKGSGEATILNVSFQQNYLQDKKKTKDYILIEDLLDSLNYKSQQIQNKISTLNELQIVLQSNKSIGGANNGVSSEKLEGVVEYYNKKSLAIKEDVLENNLKLKKLNEQIEKAKKQLATLNVKKNQPAGNIIVNVDAKIKGVINFEVSYIIESNAGWYAFYDIRAKDINSPIELVCKAKVNQTTGEDWNNVKLKLNTGNAAQSSLKPDLSPWYLDLISEHPVLYYAPSVKSARADKSEVNAMAADESKSLEQVVVTVNQNQLSSDFEIMNPYSIPSDGKDYQVDIQRYNLKADFAYEAIPKLDADAFLTAKIINTEDLSLTPGSANVYFDGAFVGETYFNPLSTGDTLTVSLGRDKRIIIKREKLKDFSGSKLFGSNKERSFSYAITVKNGKKEAINISIYDQVPISNTKEIEVKPGDYSGAEYNSSTGEIKWKLNIPAGETQKKTLSYSVKYPKDKQISGL